MVTHPIINKILQKEDAVRDAANTISYRGASGVPPSVREDSTYLERNPPKGPSLERSWDDFPSPWSDWSQWDQAWNDFTNTDW